MGNAAKIPVGTGMIKKAKTGIQKKRAAQYKLMFDTGMMSKEEYNKAIKKLGL